MRVKASDEERLRKAGKILNESLKSYKEKFGIEDFQDLLAMVAFDCQVNAMKQSESHSTDNEVTMSQLKNLNQLISEAL